MTIRLSKERIITGNKYNTFIAMCRDLEIYIDDIALTKSCDVGSRKIKIIKKIQEYAEFNPDIKPFTIGKLINNPQSSESIIDLMRSCIKQMINDEYEDVSIIKFHKDLTIELGYMNSNYSDLINAKYKSDKQRVSIYNSYGILNNDNYAKYAIDKLTNKIKGHIKSSCNGLAYEGVIIENKPVKFIDQPYYEFLDFTEQQIYNGFKDKAKEDINEILLPIKKEYDKNHNKKFRIDYRSITRTATEQFKDWKKQNNYNAENMAMAYIFEVDGDFKPIPQTVNVKQLNDSLLKSYLALLKLHVLENYITTNEYKQIILDSNSKFMQYSGLICSDYNVREALTIASRKTIEKNSNVDERHIPLDFSLLNIESYINDLKAIELACKV